MNELLIGLWIFSGLIFQGRDYPPPNPHFHLEYVFEKTGQNRLKYWRDNEDGFCEREAFYEWDGRLLTQKVTAVNPENSRLCASDPDMIPGTESRTRLEIKDGKLHLFLSLGEDTIVYVWEKAEPTRPASRLSSSFRP